MAVQIHFQGPTRYKIRSAVGLGKAILAVSTRRLFKGPSLPGWNWFVEVSTRVLQAETQAAFRMRDVREARRYLDAMEIGSPALSSVDIRQVVQPRFRGGWFIANGAESSRTMLYLHGGGYSFYPRAYRSFIAALTMAAKARTLALDYRLTPEHRFPAQLDDALNAYRWLLENGADRNQLIVAGDSAGGNLALALLQAVRNARLALPGLAVVLSPPTDFEAQLTGTQDSDWIEEPMLRQWADWYCDRIERRNPLVSPIHADLQCLPPIYIQAGRAEILYDSIHAFAGFASRQGADVVLDSWDDMNHNFQIFGDDAPQSREALQRIAKVIDTKLCMRMKPAGIAAAYG